MPWRHFRSFFAFTCFLALASLLRAEGSPPLITDDPDTPPRGHWEINLGVSTERRPGEQLSELPLIDLNYGFRDNIQLKFEVPFLVESIDGASRVSGFGNSEVGVKWRFRDESESGAAISVYPQFAFNNPGSSAADRGLVEPGSAFLLPVQLQQKLGPITLNLQLGHEFRSSADSWFYGAALSHDLGDRFEVAFELAGSAASRLDRSQLAMNFGFVFNLSERDSLMISVGRELHNHDEPRATLIGYVGWQLRR